MCVSQAQPQSSTLVSSTTVMLRIIVPKCFNSSFSSLRAPILFRASFVEYLNMFASKMDACAKLSSCNNFLCVLSVQMLRGF